jgi:hypothetical protein
VPSAFQPVFGSGAVIGAEPPPTVSKYSICPPSTVGSPAGGGKVPTSGLATILARMAGLTMVIFPSIGTSAARAEPTAARATRQANPSALGVQKLRMTVLPPLWWAGASRPVGASLLAPIE